MPTALPLLLLLISIVLGQPQYYFFNEEIGSNINNNCTVQLQPCKTVSKALFNSCSSSVTIYFQSSSMSIMEHLLPLNMACNNASINIVGLKNTGTRLIIIDAQSNPVAESSLQQPLFSAASSLYAEFVHFNGIVLGNFSTCSVHLTYFSVTNLYFPWINCFDCIVRFENAHFYETKQSISSLQFQNSSVQITDVTIESIEPKSTWLSSSHSTLVFNNVTMKYCQLVRLISSFYDSIVINQFKLFSISISYEFNIIEAGYTSLKFSNFHISTITSTVRSSNIIFIEFANQISVTNGVVEYWNDLQSNFISIFKTNSVLIRNVTIQQTQLRRVFYCSAIDRLWMDQMKFENTSGRSLALFHINQFQLQNSVWKYNTDFPSLIYADNCASLSFQNIQFQNNIGEYLIYMQYSAHVSLQQVNFLENRIKVSNIFSFDVAIVIRDCQFINNWSALMAGNLYVFGHSSSVLILNSQFKNNTCELGGTLYFAAVERVILENCLFENNWGTLGSAFQAYFTEIVQVFGCQFRNNSNTEGATVELQNTVERVEAPLIGAYMQDCLFEDNQGGAIHTLFATLLTVIDCQFKNNIGVQHGGAMSIFSASVAVQPVQKTTSRSQLISVGIQIHNCYFFNNSALQGNGGAIAIPNQAYVNITQSVFVSNSAYGKGGAIYLDGIQNGDEKIYSRIMNCKFVNNEAMEEGGAIYVSSPLWIYQNQFVQCTSNTFGGAVFFHGKRTSSYFTIEENQFLENRANKSGSSIFAFIATTLLISKNSLVSSQHTGVSTIAISKEITRAKIEDNHFDSFENYSIYLDSNQFSSIRKNQFLQQNGVYFGDSLTRNEIQQLVSNNINLTTQSLCMYSSSIAISQVEYFNQSTQLVRVYPNQFVKLTLQLIQNHTQCIVTNFSIQFDQNNRWTKRSKLEFETRIIPNAKQIQIISESMDVFEQMKRKSVITTLRVELIPCPSANYFWQDYSFATNEYNSCVEEFCPISDSSLHNKIIYIIGFIVSLLCLILWCSSVVLLLIRLLSRRINNIELYFGEQLCYCLIEGIDSVCIFAIVLIIYISFVEFSIYNDTNSTTIVRVILLVLMGILFFIRNIQLLILWFILLRYKLAKIVLWICVMISSSISIFITCGFFAIGFKNIVETYYMFGIYLFVMIIIQTAWNSLIAIATFICIIFIKNTFNPFLPNLLHIFLKNWILVLGMIPFTIVSLCKPLFVSIFFIPISLVEAIVLLLIIGSSKIKILHSNSKTSIQEEKEDFELENIYQEFSSQFIIDSQSIQILELLGQGAQAQVYYAEYNSNPIALKIFKTEEFGYKMDLKNFFVEARNLFRYSHHQNIVRFYGISYDEEKQRVSILLEFYKNGSLAKWLDKAVLTWTQKIQIVLGIAQGMVHLHSIPVIHRDLKPDNIMLDTNYQPKIADFGLAKFQHTTQNTMTVGTSYYIAPELLKQANSLVEQTPITLQQKKKVKWSNETLYQPLVSGTEEIPPLRDQSNSSNNSQTTKRTTVYDKSCDVYSFGIIMYCIVCDVTNPYPGKSDIEVILNVCKNPYFRPSLTNDKIVTLLEKGDRWYIDLMSRCWSDSPNQRPSFPEIVELIKQYM